MTARTPYPLSALVGLETLKTALLLAAVDERLGVLVRGDKGAGKSTAARALAALLHEGAPFVDLPVGATEDRLLGGLDVERAMKGEPALKPGLLSQAHGGVLYIDEVNLLPDHLADALLDAAASGVHVVEREGWSASHEARFVLIGSMNPEEGALRPQLLDRFAIAVDVSAPMEPAARRLAVERRLAFDADATCFAGAWAAEEENLSRRVQEARAALASVGCSGAIVEQVATEICAQGVRSLRADLAVIRGSRALAALQGSSIVEPDHVAAVLPLALAHRSRAPQAPRPPSPPPPGSGSHPGSSDRETPTPERVFELQEMRAPRLISAADPQARGGAATARDGDRRGPAVRARPTEAPRELDVRATVAHALAYGGAPIPRQADLHEKVRVPRSRRRFLFVVDSSGSHAAQHRMRLVKGAVLALLETSAERQDEVAVIAFRATTASIVVEPTRNRDDARRALEHLPTGGRTPLAHALELAARLATPETTLVLVTDGKANVPSRTEDAWTDALAAAAAIDCPVLVVDSELDAQGTGRGKALATALHATHVMLDGLEGEQLLRLADACAETRRDRMA